MTSPLRHLDRLRGTRLARRLQALPLAERAYRASRAAVVEERLHFAASEALARPGIFVYTLRSGGRVAMRHRIPDVVVLDEIFWWDFYEPPTEAAALLPGADEAILIVDLGANVGMFGVWSLGRWPRAEIVGVEPDRENARVCSAAIRANGAGGHWRIIEACAGTEAGTVTFLSGQGAQSRVVSEGGGEQQTLSVEQIDAFEVISTANLVKIDIEGSEWPLLADPRMSSLAADVILLEYHAWGAPGPDVHDDARRLLAAAGYEGYAVERMPDDCGIAWAWRLPDHPAPAAGSTDQRSGPGR